MIKRALFLCLMLVTTSLAKADGLNLFAGGGFNMGSQSIVNDTVSSKFTSRGLVAELGFDMGFGGGSFNGGGSGLRLTGEYGQSSASNNYNSENYLELGDSTYYAARAGLYYSKFGLDLGYRKMNMDIKSVSTGTSGAQKNSYSGMAPFAALNLNFDFDKRYRTVLEAAYLTGKLKSSDTSSATTDYTINELTIGLRFVFMFD